MSDLFEGTHMSPEEFKGAIHFTELQLKALNFLLADAYEAKVRLPVDPTDITSYIQQEAAIRGEIEILERLINLSSIETKGT